MITFDSPVDGRLLQNLELFAALSAEQCDRLAQPFQAMALKEDERLFAEGEPADKLYIVMEGRVALAVSMPGKRWQDSVVSTVSKGQLLGWSALVPNSRWQATAFAVKPSSLLCAPAESIQALCDADREIGYLLMRTALNAVGQRLSDCRLQYLDIFGQNDE